MRIPLTPHGTPQILLFAVVPAAAGVATWAFGLWPVSVLLFALAVFTLSFFRDPERATPSDEGTLVSPADGTVVNVLEVDEPLYLRGRGIRVGIFLSVFDVHVNRSPGAGVVEFVKYTPGRFLDARDPRSIEENEANAIGIQLDDGRRVLVRQVAGLIARRIVCPVSVGDRVERGQRMGMIKFGSYTELIVEKESGFEAKVAVTETVHGAQTVMFRRAQ